MDTVFSAITPVTGVKTVFFDLGGTLVEPAFTPSGEFGGFEVLPGAAEGLAALAASNRRLGVVSNTGDIDPQEIRQALESANLLAFFASDLIVLSGEVGIDKRSTKIFRLALARAGAVGQAGTCAFVGDEPTERRTASSVGLRTSRSLEAFLKRASLTPGGGVAGPSGTDAPDLSNIDACVRDARDAGLDSAAGPAEPNNYQQLLLRLEAAKTKLPPIYVARFAEPFIAELRRLGPQGFADVLMSDPARERAAGLMMDMAHVILQNGEGFESQATDAFQEVVGDLYDGFLSAGDRAGNKLPDHAMLAPLIKWGNPDFGPYTWPITATSIFSAEAAVVSLPPANARKGLFAWTALGHETAGHDIIHADDGLEEEMSQTVFSQLSAASIGAGLADYWSARIDETASDVMGILNMGPAAAIGLAIYFRGLNAAFGGQARLRNEGPASDSHPADILRGFLAASTVRLLSFDGAAAWAEAIDRETMKDVTQIRVAGVPITVERAKRSCEIVAHALAATRMAALNGHSLIEIQDWRNRDEEIVAAITPALLTNSPVSMEHQSGIYAAHVVAAAALAAAAGAAPIGNIFQRMLGVLKTMHDANAAWGPLFVAHPGTISRHIAYVRHADRR
jgi:hypothetical protein